MNDVKLEWDEVQAGVNLRGARSLCREDVRRLLPVRDRYAHKGMFGKVLLICGATGYSGAAAMAARAALRCGSGMVTLCVPQSIYPIVAAKLDEAMVQPLICDEAGRISEAALGQLLPSLQSADAVLIGPGLGRSAGLTRLCLALLQQTSCPVVLDADGLNAVCAHIDTVREVACPLIITPHDGEFRRLVPDCDLPARELPKRAAAAKQLAQQMDAVVLLKGHRTVITDGTQFYINRTGNPGMAGGGSGDVLAGVIVSLLGQGVAPLEAAALGAWLHGAAGDLCADEIGECGMLATDMIMAMTRLLK